MLPLKTLRAWLARLRLRLRQHSAIKHSLNEVTVTELLLITLLSFPCKDWRGERLPEQILLLPFHPFLKAPYYFSARTLVEKLHMINYQKKNPVLISKKQHI